jgi:transcriptional regulator with XRE-family HTH domain
MPRPPSHPHVLRTARQRKGFTQTRLAKRAGVSVATIKQIESGKTKVSRITANRIATILRLDVQQLQENSDPDSPTFYPSNNSAEMPDIAKDRKIFIDTLDHLLSRPRDSVAYWILRYALFLKFAEIRQEFGYPPKVIPSSTRQMRETIARKLQPQRVSPGCDNDGRKPAIHSRVPSAQRSRRRA